ncbi:MAG: hypothetical protein K9W46_09965 [Candidatus Heimdallarchaeum endolithica]|uniref:Uncharacterized protein n=1 Tax=Candidatus Heimdallarchaeum endolithica TaxID=2876572 RepID=A0A9Y1BPK0_9ARCH|nr:MAG: hypothetical protein K9W46_09965 [Candidatus Heimdallarchaeum endolithica]
MSKKIHSNKFDLLSNLKNINNKKIKFIVLGIILITIFQGITMFTTPIKGDSDYTFFYDDFSNSTLPLWHGGHRKFVLDTDGWVLEVSEGQIAVSEKFELIWGSEMAPKISIKNIQTTYLSYSSKIQLLDANNSRVLYTITRSMLESSTELDLDLSMYVFGDTTSMKIKIYGKVRIGEIKVYTRKLYYHNFLLDGTFNNDNDSNIVTLYAFNSFESDAVYIPNVPVVTLDYNGFMISPIEENNHTIYFTVKYCYVDYYGNVREVIISESWDDGTIDEDLLFDSTDLEGLRGKTIWFKFEFEIDYGHEETNPIEIYFSELSIKTFYYTGMHNKVINPTEYLAKNPRSKTIVTDMYGSDVLALSTDRDGYVASYLTEITESIFHDTLNEETINSSYYSDENILSSNLVSYDDTVVMHDSCRIIKNDSEVAEFQIHTSMIIEKKGIVSGIGIYGYMADVEFGIGYILEVNDGEKSYFYPALVIYKDGVITKIEKIDDFTLNESVSFGVKSLKGLRAYQVSINSQDLIINMPTLYGFHGDVGIFSVFDNVVAKQSGGATVKFDYLSLDAPDYEKANRLLIVAHSYQDVMVELYMTTYGLNGVPKLELIGEKLLKKGIIEYLAFPTTLYMYNYIHIFVKGYNQETQTYEPLKTPFELFSIEWSGVHAFGEVVNAYDYYSKSEYSHVEEGNLVLNDVDNQYFIASYDMEILEPCLLKVKAKSQGTFPNTQIDVYIRRLNAPETFTFYGTISWTEHGSKDFYSHSLYLDLIPGNYEVRLERHYSLEVTPEVIEIQSLMTAPIGFSANALEDASGLNLGDDGWSYNFYDEETSENLSFDDQWYETYGYTLFSPSLINEDLDGDGITDVVSDYEFIDAEYKIVGNNLVAFNGEVKIPNVNVDLTQFKYMRLTIYSLKENYTLVYPPLNISVSVDFNIINSEDNIIPATSTITKEFVSTKERVITFNIENIADTTGIQGGNVLKDITFRSADFMVIKNIIIYKIDMSEGTIDFSIPREKTHSVPFLSDSRLVASIKNNIQSYLDTPVSLYTNPYLYTLIDPELQPSFTNDPNDNPLTPWYVNTLPENAPEGLDKTSFRVNPQSRLFTLSSVLTNLDIYFQISNSSIEDIWKKVKPVDNTTINPEGITLLEYSLRMFDSQAYKDPSKILDNTKIIVKFYPYNQTFVRNKGYDYIGFLKVFLVFPSNPDTNGDGKSDMVTYGWNQTIYSDKDITEKWTDPSSTLTPSFSYEDLSGEHCVLLGSRIDVRDYETLVLSVHFGQTEELKRDYTDDFEADYDAFFVTLKNVNDEKGKLVFYSTDSLPSYAKSYLSIYGLPTTWAIEWKPELLVEEYNAYCLFYGTPYLLENKDIFVANYPLKVDFTDPEIYKFRKGEYLFIPNNSNLTRTFASKKISRYGLSSPFYVLGKISFYNNTDDSSPIIAKDLTFNDYQNIKYNFDYNGKITRYDLQINHTQYLTNLNGQELYSCIDYLWWDEFKAIDTASYLFGHGESPDERWVVPSSGLWFENDWVDKNRNGLIDGDEGIRVNPLTHVSPFASYNGLIFSVDSYSNMEFSHAENLRWQMFDDEDHDGTQESLEVWPHITPVEPHQTGTTIDYNSYTLPFGETWVRIPKYELYDFDDFNSAFIFRYPAMLRQNSITYTEYFSESGTETYDDDNIFTNEMMIFDQYNSLPIFYSGTYLGNKNLFEFDVKIDSWSVEDLWEQGYFSINSDNRINEEERLAFYKTIPIFLPSHDSNHPKVLRIFVYYDSGNYFDGYGDLDNEVVDFQPYYHVYIGRSSLGAFRNIEDLTLHFNIYMEEISEDSYKYIITLSHDGYNKYYYEPMYLQQQTYINSWMEDGDGDDYRHIITWDNSDPLTEGGISDSAYTFTLIEGENDEYVGSGIYENGSICEDYTKEYAIPEENLALYYSGHKIIEFENRFYLNSSYYTHTFSLLPPNCFGFGLNDLGISIGDVFIHTLAENEKSSVIKKAEDYSNSSWINDGERIIIQPESKTLLDRVIKAGSATVIEFSPYILGAITEEDFVDLGVFQQSNYEYVLRFKLSSVSENRFEVGVFRKIIGANEEQIGTWVPIPVDLGYNSLYQQFYMRVRIEESYIEFDLWKELDRESDMLTFTVPTFSTLQECELVFQTGELTGLTMEGIHSSSFHHVKETVEGMEEDFYLGEGTLGDYYIQPPIDNILEVSGEVKLSTTVDSVLGENLPVDFALDIKPTLYTKLSLSVFGCYYSGIKDYTVGSILIEGKKLRFSYGEDVSSSMTYSDGYFVNHTFSLDEWNRIYFRYVNNSYLSFDETLNATYTVEIYELLIYINGEMYNVTLDEPLTYYPHFTFEIHSRAGLTEIDDLYFGGIEEDFDDDQIDEKIVKEEDLSGATSIKNKLLKKVVITVFGCTVYDIYSEVSVTVTDQHRTSETQTLKWEQISSSLERRKYTYTFETEFDYKKPLRITLTSKRISAIFHLMIENEQHASSFLYVPQVNDYESAKYVPVKYTGGQQIVHDQELQQKVTKFSLPIGGYLPLPDKRENFVLEGFAKGKGNITFDTPFFLTDIHTNERYPVLLTLNFGMNDSERDTGAYSYDSQSNLFTVTLTCTKEEGKWSYFRIDLFQLILYIKKTDTYPASFDLSEYETYADYGYGGFSTEKQKVEFTVTPDTTFYLTEFRVYNNLVAGRYPYAGARVSAVNKDTQSFVGELKWQQYNVSLDGWINLDEVFVYHEFIDNQTHITYDLVLYLTSDFTSSKVFFEIETNGIFVLSTGFATIMKKQELGMGSSTRFFTPQTELTPLFLHLIFPVYSFPKKIRISYMSDGIVQLNAGENNNRIREWLVSNAYYNDGESTAAITHLLSRTMPLEGETFLLNNEERFVFEKISLEDEYGVFSLGELPYSVHAGQQVALVTCVDFTQDINESELIIAFTHETIVIKQLMIDGIPLVMDNEAMWNEITFYGDKLLIPLNSEGLNRKTEPWEVYGDIRDNREVALWAGVAKGEVNESSVLDHYSSPPSTIFLNKKGIHQISLILERVSEENAFFGAIIEPCWDLIHNFVEPDEVHVDYSNVLAKNTIRFNNQLEVDFTRKKSDTKTFAYSKMQTIDTIPLNPYNVYKGGFYVDSYGTYHHWRVYFTGISGVEELYKGKKWYDEEGNLITPTNGTKYNWKFLLFQMNYAIVLDKGTSHSFVQPFSFLVGMYSFVEYWYFQDRNNNSQYDPGIDSEWIPKLYDGFGVPDIEDCSIIPGANETLVDPVTSAYRYGVPTSSRDKIHLETVAGLSLDLSSQYNSSLNVDISEARSISIDLEKEEEKETLTFIDPLNSTDFKLTKDYLIENTLDYNNNLTQTYALRTTVQFDNFELEMYRPKIDSSYLYLTEKNETYSRNYIYDEQSHTLYTYHTDLVSKESYGLEMVNTRGRVYAYNTNAMFGLPSANQIDNCEFVREWINETTERTIGEGLATPEVWTNTNILPSLYGNVKNDFISSFQIAIAYLHQNIMLVDMDLPTDVVSLTIFDEILGADYTWEDIPAEFYDENGTLIYDVSAGIIEFAIHSSDILTYFTTSYPLTFWDRTKELKGWSKFTMGVKSFLLPLKQMFSIFFRSGGLIKGLFGNWRGNDGDDSVLSEEDYRGWKSTFILLWGLMLGTTRGAGLAKGEIFDTSEKTKSLLCINDYWDWYLDSILVKNEPELKPRDGSEPSKYLPLVPDYEMEEILQDWAKSGNWKMIDWMTNEEYTPEHYNMNKRDAYMYYHFKEQLMKYGPYSIKVYSVQEAYSDGHEDFDDGYFIIAVPSLTDSGDYDWYVSLDYFHYFNGKKTKLSDFEALAFWEMLVNTFSVTALLADIRDSVCAPDAFVRAMALSQIPMDIINIICFFAPTPTQSPTKDLLNSMTKASRITTKTTKGFIRFISNVGSFAERRIIKFITKRNKFLSLLDSGGKIALTLRLLKYVNTFAQITIFLPQKLLLLTYSAPLMGINTIVKEAAELFSKATDIDVVAAFVLRKWVNNELLSGKPIKAQELVELMLKSRVTAQLIMQNTQNLIMEAPLKYLSLSYITALNVQNEGVYPVYSVTPEGTKIDKIQDLKTTGAGIIDSKLSFKESLDLLDHFNVFEAIKSEGICLVRNSFVDWDKTIENVKEMKRKLNPTITEKELEEITEKTIKELKRTHSRSPEFFIRYVELPDRLAGIINKEELLDIFSENLDVKFFNWLKENGYGQSLLVKLFDPTTDGTEEFTYHSQLKSVIPLFTLLQRMFLYKELTQKLFENIKEKESTSTTKVAAEKSINILKELLRKTDKILYNTLDSKNPFISIKESLKEGEKKPFNVNLKNTILKSTIELINPQDKIAENYVGIDLITTGGNFVELKYLSNNDLQTSFTHKGKYNFAYYLTAGLLDNFPLAYDYTNKEAYLTSKLLNHIIKKEVDYRPRNIASNTGIFSTLLGVVNYLFCGQTNKITTDEMAMAMLGYKISYHASTGYSTLLDYVQVVDKKNNDITAKGKYLQFQPIKSTERLKIAVRGILNVIDTNSLNEKFRTDFGENAKAYFITSHTKGYVIVFYTTIENGQEKVVSKAEYLDCFNSEYAKDEKSVRIIKTDYIPTEHIKYTLKVDENRITEIEKSEPINYKLYSFDGKEIELKNGIGLDTWARIRVVIEKNNELIPVLILQDRDGKIIKDSKGEMIYWPINSKLNGKNALTGKEQQIVNLAQQLNNIQEVSTYDTFTILEKNLKLSKAEIWKAISDNALYFSKFLKNKNVLALEMDINKDGKIIIDKRPMNVNDAVEEMKKYLEVINRMDDKAEIEKAKEEDYQIVEQLAKILFTSEAKIDEELMIKLRNEINERIIELKRLKEMASLFNPKERINKMVNSFLIVNNVNSPISPAEVNNKLAQILENVLTPIGYYEAFKDQLTEEEINIFTTGRKEYNYEIDVVETLLVEDDDLLAQLTKKNPGIKSQIVRYTANNEGRSVKIKSKISELVTLMRNVDKIVLDKNMEFLINENGYIRAIIEKIILETKLGKWYNKENSGELEGEKIDYKTYKEQLEIVRSKLKSIFGERVYIPEVTEDTRSLYMVFLIRLKENKVNNYRFVEIIQTKKLSKRTKDDYTICISFHGGEKGTRKVLKIMNEIIDKEMKKVAEINQELYNKHYKEMLEKIKGIIGEIQTGDTINLQKDITKYGRIDYLVTAEGLKGLFGETKNEMGISIEMLNSLIALAYMKAEEENVEEVKISMEELTNSVNVFCLYKKYDKLNLKLVEDEGGTFHRVAISYKKNNDVKKGLIYPITKYGLMNYEEALKTMYKEYLIWEDVYGTIENYYDIKNYYNENPQDIRYKIQKYENVKLGMTFYYRIWEAITTEMKKNKPK